MKNKIVTVTLTEKVVLRVQTNKFIVFSPFAYQFAAQKNLTIVSHRKLLIFLGALFSKTLSRPDGKVYKCYLVDQDDVTIATFNRSGNDVGALNSPYSSMRPHIQLLSQNWRNNISMDYAKSFRSSSVRNCFRIQASYELTTVRTWMCKGFLRFKVLRGSPSVKSLTPLMLESGTTWCFNTSWDGQ